MNKQIEKYTYFRSFWLALKNRPEKVRLEVRDAMDAYAFTGEIAEGLSEEAESLLSLIFPNIKASISKSLNGRKGGAPKGNSNALKQHKVELEKQPKNNLACFSETSNKDKDMEKDKDIKEKDTKKKDDKKEFIDSLPTVWKGLVEYWLKYKSRRGESYKTAQSLKVFFNNLKAYSLDDPNTGRQIIEQSVGNNWAGIFPLKDTRKGKPSAFVQPSGNYEINPEREVL